MGAYAMNDELMREAWSLLQVVGVSGVAGWMATRLLDPGLATRGLALLAGLFGCYAGSWTLELTGWPPGPTIAGESVMGAFAGALAICAFLKLVSVGLDGPRW